MSKNAKILKKEKVMYIYIAFFVVVSLYVGLLFYNSVIYEDKIYPGISVAGVSVGGKTKKEAEEIISKKVEENRQNPVFIGRGKYELNEKDLNLVYDVPGTVEKAFDIGRNDDLNPTKNYSENISINVSVDHTKLSNELIEITHEENQKVEDAEIFMVGDDLSTTPESIGSRVLLTENINKLIESLGNFEYEVNLQKRIMEPSVKEENIIASKDRIQSVLSRKIILKDGNDSYGLKEKSMASFLSFRNGQEGPSLAYAMTLDRFFPAPITGSNVDISFDRNAIRDWAVSFSKDIDSEPQNAKLSGGSGGVNIVSSSKDGKRVMIDDFVKKISDALVGSVNEVEIPIQVTKAEVRDDNLNELGLKGLVSRGYSSFSGSPKNRIHNIKTGASKFNGVLIKPDENFSFNETIGEVEASTGYLPELVIKKDKTVPEYGGGLCQVSSTAFRAALNAGLPITSRSAHAYPVQYYTPYGVDATIYIPSPDLTFKNDTGGYILIQTLVSGNKLYFDFYGTKKAVVIKFAGDENATVGVSDYVEGITPTITEKEARGEGSFTAEFYRFLYDSSGKLIKKNNWVSKYDSPKKYPH